MLVNCGVAADNGAGDNNSHFDSNPAVTNVNCYHRPQFWTDNRLGNDDPPEELREDADFIDKNEVVKRRTVGDDDHLLRLKAVARSRSKSA